MELRAHKYILRVQMSITSFNGIGKHTKRQFELCGVSISRGMIYALIQVITNTLGYMHEGNKLGNMSNNVAENNEW